jgi:hypothetical protein
VRPHGSLLAIALKNAVEGCVRETYGAVVNLVESRWSSDPEVRRAMWSIAENECRHAELARALARWARTTTERARDGKRGESQSGGVTPARLPEKCSRVFEHFLCVSTF